MTPAVGSYRAQKHGCLRRFMPKHWSNTNFFFFFFFLVRAEIFCHDPTDKLSLHSSAAACGSEHAVASWNGIPHVCTPKKKKATKKSFPRHSDSAPWYTLPPRLLSASRICVSPLLWSSMGMRLMCRRVNEQLWWCRIVQRTSKAVWISFISWHEWEPMTPQSECMCCCHTLLLGRVQSTKYWQIQKARPVFFFFFLTTLNCSDTAVKIFPGGGANL